MIALSCLALIGLAGSLTVAIAIEEQTIRIDGVVRILSYRTLQDYPLVVLVGTSQSEALASFYKYERDYYFLTFASITALVAFFAIAWMGALSRQRVALDSLSRAETQFRATYNQAAVGIARISARRALRRGESGAVPDAGLFGAGSVDALRPRRDLSRRPVDGSGAGLQSAGCSPARTRRHSPRPRPAACARTARCCG